MNQDEGQAELYQLPPEPVRGDRPRAYLTTRAFWLGKVATAAATNFRQFLKKDISIPTVNLKAGVQTMLERDAETSDVNVLKKMVNQSKEVIARVQTVFPFTLFPDDIILDRTKITLIKRNFFWSADVISIRIEDVLNVGSSVGPFFGSITISSRVMNSIDHFEIDRLWRRDAIEVKTLIQGYMIAKHSNAGLDHLSIPELIDTLRDLGHDPGTAVQ